ncbi:MAG: helix-turn-helix transcriptional regulator [Clostridia bacterium]|nr:helix-turn-helix transcriptional regulator [Clostridia bacterium]
MIIIKDLKPIIAKNISELRRVNDTTQAELAEKLNYSDKAVSKWERGESVPDVTVLSEIADIFGVTVDYLLTEDHAPVDEIVESDIKILTKNRVIITVMSLFLVLLISTFAFVIMNMAMEFRFWHFLCFLYALPVCSIILIVFNTIWFNTRFNFVYISLLMWSLLAALIVTFLACGINIALLAVVGIPGQIIIIMWSQLKFTSKKLVSKLKSKNNTKYENAEH